MLMQYFIFKQCNMMLKIIIFITYIWSAGFGMSFESCNNTDGDVPLICSCPACPSLYPSKTFCSVYYIIQDGAFHLHRCPSGLLFNDEIFSCDYDFNVDCGNRSTEASTLSSPIDGNVTAGTLETNKGNSTYISELIMPTTTVIKSDKPETNDNIKFSTRVPESRDSYFINRTSPYIEIKQETTNLPKQFSTIIENNFSTETTPTSINKNTNYETTSITEEKFKELSTIDADLITMPTSNDNEAISTMESKMSTDYVFNTTNSNAHQNLLTDSQRKDTTLSFLTDKTHNNTTYKMENSSTGPIFSTEVSSLNNINNTNVLYTTESITSSIKSDLSITTKEVQVFQPRETSSPLVETEDLNSSDFTTAQQTLSEEIDKIQSNFLCPEQYGLFPDPEKCNYFYQCSDFISYKLQCPPYLHFNAVLLFCDWPQFAGCDKR